jgi:hypothetical protein
VEQRADETSRLSRIAAEDAGPPAGDNGQTDAVPTADEDAGEKNGHSPEEPAGWTTGRSASGGSADTEPDYPAPSATGIYPSASTYPSAGGTYQPADGTYPATHGDDSYTSAEVAGAYAGPTVDDGYGPPGTERNYTAPSGTERNYPSSTERDYTSSSTERDYSAPSRTDRDYPASSAARREYPAPSTPDREYPAPPGESVYGSAGTTQRDYSAAPYPAQVSPPAPDPQPERASRTTGWQAATARMPRPQVVPKRPKAARTDQDGSAARQAHLTVARFEPWSVMKFSFMLSLVCFVILFVAVALLYGTLAGLGVFDAIQKALSNVTSGQGTNGVNLSHYFSASTVLTYTALLGILDVVLITAFATVGSVVYNLAAHLVGGVEVTLKETE